MKRKILDSLESMELDEEIFVDVFKFQYENNEIYRKFCNFLGKNKRNVKEIKDIPLMPVRFFKRYEIKTFRGRPKLSFISSGTSEGISSKSFYKDIEFINKSILNSFEYFLLPDNMRVNFYVFFEPFNIRKTSSLSYMFSLVSKNFSKRRYFIYEKKQYEDVLRKLEKEKRPVLILGTTISLYDFISFLKEKDKVLYLKEGSRIMDTGGWKGRKLNIKGSLLLRMYKDYLNIPETHVINEYGMCELASQFYDITLRKFVFEKKKTRYKYSLPFLRFRIINEEGREDKRGLVATLDLFNLDTCSFLLTPDMGRKKAKGFEIIERVDDELRGCALISESILF